MDVEIATKNNKNYLISTSSETFIRTPQDILDLLSLGGQKRVRLFALKESNVDPAFYKLSSGLAGEMLQKFSNYRVRAFFLGTFEAVQSEKFRELMLECNRGDQIRFDSDLDRGLDWLTR